MYLQGVQVREVKRIVDDRGFFSELFRFDWNDLFEQDPPVQFNYVTSHPNVIRAWHRHNQGQIDYFTCLEGSIKICVYDDNESPTKHQLNEIVISSDKPVIVKVPGNYWHGYKVLGNKPAKILYGVNRLYNYSNPDEERRKWDDQDIVPLSINGSTKDSRIGTTWNWNYPPHR